MSGAVTTAPLDVDLSSDEATPTSSARGQLLKRVLSQGSNSSTSASASANLATPTSSTIPLSPSSRGVRTPKARVAALKPDPEVLTGDGKAQELVSDMDGLQVQSPLQDPGALPGGPMQDANGLATDAAGHDRSLSSSTDSSTTSGNPHPVPPSHLGSAYGSEGFPLDTDGPEESAHATNGAPPYDPTEAQMSEYAAAVVAAADEAIKQLNGTATVFQGPPTPGLPPPDNPFQLPRGYASFVKPQARSDSRISDHLVTRQSSTSSTATEASTSSEESDLCVPSIEWVNLPNIISPTTGHPFPQSPHLSSPTVVFQQQQRGTPGRSPGRMAPPLTTGRGVNSPRRSSAVLANVTGHEPRPPSLPHQQSRPLGATAQTPSGLRQHTSALPVGLPPTASADEDDDEATVGHGRDRSPSTSSQSAQSGLDLLWQAAATHRVVTPDSPYEDPVDSKGKRKAGAEAVAQWRTSGIPSGKPGKAGEEQTRAKEEKSMPPPPPKKRRRSDMLEEVDPSLRDVEYNGDSAMEVDHGSDYQSGSASEEAGEIPSGDDSEYGGSGKPQGRATGRGRSGGKKGGRARVSTATGTGTGTGGGSTSGKATGSKKGRKSGESPNGSGRDGEGGRRASAGAPGFGVQCEYVNPLPVSPP